MYHVVVATRNPAKIRAVTAAFAELYGSDQITVSGVDVPSGVAAQPMSAEETWQGANQRLINAQDLGVAADFWVAIEAGLDGAQAFAWILIEHQGKRSEARSASFMLPTAIVERLTQGQELGQVMAHLTGIDDIKYQGGAIGAITQGLLDRAAVYQQALILAISSLSHPLYSVEASERSVADNQ